MNMVLKTSEVFSSAVSREDIKDQVAGSFREREIFRSYAQASPAEEFGL